MASLARAVASSRRPVAAVALASMLLCVALAGNAHAAPVPDGLLAGESGESHFGQSIALSADGDTALVGAPTAGGGAGAVLVFTRTGSTWTQRAELTPASGEEIGDGAFGTSVALSSEGNTAVIGAPADSLDAGAVWVFTRSSEGAWTQQGAKLTPAVGEESLTGAFGSSVALSKDGAIALIGAPGDSGEAGAAWAFTRSEAGAWTQQGTKLTAKAGEETGSGAFGSSVALSKDGAIALIGAPGDSGEAGAVWAFTYAEGAWTQQGAKLTGGGEEGEGAFGSSVALSKDGDTALIGGPGDGEPGSEPLRGAAWVFTRSQAGAWAQQGEKLVAKTGEAIGEGRFGSSVALSKDGAIALIGAPADNTNVGAAWSFTRSEAGAWSQQGQKLTGSGEEGEGQFGSSVALSADGYTELTGGPADNTNTGAVWAFVTPPTVSGVSPDKGPEAGETSVTITGTNFSEAAAVEFGSVSATSFEVISPTSITAIAPPGAGAADVTVTTSGGVSATGSADRFTYVPPPTVMTKAASSITQTTATLNATVDPNGGEVTSCNFEYGTTELYGSSVPCSSLPGSGTGPVAVSAPLENLTPNTPYYFRIVATSLGGTSTDILHPQTFTTLPDAPTVVTEAASSIAQTTVTLNATVNPNGGEVTSCKFDYGTTEAYGKSAPCSSLPGSGTSTVAVSAGLESLSPNTTYHFRVVATNPGGTSDGSDQAFKTLPNGPVVVTKAASSITQSTATLNATVNPNGGEVTSCKFDYGTTEAYGKSAPCSSLPGSGTSAVAVSAAVGGLSPNTTYHFRVVATNSGGTSDGSDQTLTTLPNPPTVVTKAASSITQTTATLNATVNPNGGEITSCELDYGTTETYDKSVPCSTLPGSGGSAVAVSAAVTGLSANTTYHFQIVATNAGGTSKGSDQTFKTLPDAPTVVTKAASSVSQTTATLNTTVNPNGGEVTSCEFDYGTTESYGKSAPCSSLPGSGTSPVAVSASLKSLSANTTYHFRVVATNPGGTSEGSDQTFKTLPDAPTVVTGAASSLTQTSATLNATVNPNGGEVGVGECKLEYGTTITYGHEAPCSPSPGSGNSAVAVSASVMGLSANTTYHFRIVATNAGGTGIGTDQTFKTLPNPPTVVTNAASSIMQTTATLNATVNPNGGEVSSCKLEYGTSETYGSSVSCTPSSPGSGNSAVAVSASVTGLSANTTYHFRVVATNAGGTGTGSDGTFKTLPNAPTVVTEQASFPPAQTSATINATVNPNGGEVTNCHFDYGITSGYGREASCSSLPGSGISAVAVSASLTGLSPNTLYYFRIVATNAGGTSTDTINAQTFETAPGPPAIVAEGATEIKPTTAILNATANLLGGKISQCYFNVFDSQTDQRVFSRGCTQPQDFGTVKVSALAEELSPETSYYFTVDVENNFEERSFVESQVFKTAPGPGVVTGAASLVTQKSATLNATVNPNGDEVENCKFEYGTSTSYEKSVPCSPPSPGSGTSPVAVSAPALKLSENTTYHFRIVARNSGGVSLGADHTFSTLPNPPTVVTSAASSPTQTAATLNGTVNPNGGEVKECRFEYGTSTSYGASIPCSSPPGSGTSAVAVSAGLESLSPNTTYHFRIVATNLGGKSEGADQSFTTEPAPPPPLPPTTTTSTTTTTTTTTPAETVLTTTNTTAETTSTPSTTPEPPAATCRVSLASTSITTKSGGMAAIRLVWTGTGASTCGGKLTLTAKAKGKSRRPKATLIGTGAFSIPFGKDQIVRVKLNQAGRALLSADHGRLSAKLAILQLFPDPSPAQIETIHFTLEARLSSKGKR
jgi:phosphodiesterase/alkaline phosphatase D-like protein